MTAASPDTAHLTAAVCLFRGLADPARGARGRDPGGGRDAARLAAAVCLFRGLAAPARLAIVRHLALGEHRVVDLTAHLGLAQSTASGHLAGLRARGPVAARPAGRTS